MRSRMLSKVVFPGRLSALSRGSSGSHRWRTRPWHGLSSSHSCCAWSVIDPCPNSGAQRAPAVTGMWTADCCPRVMKQGDAGRPLRLGSQRSISPRRGSRRAATDRRRDQHSRREIVVDRRRVPAHTPASHLRLSINPSRSLPFVDSRLAGPGRCRGSTISRDVLAGEQPPQGGQMGGTRACDWTGSGDGAVAAVQPLQPSASVGWPTPPRRRPCID